MGNARLLDYGAHATEIHADVPVVLFVPSLINRYYIFDLEEDRSLVRFLSRQGTYPLILDWGKPGKTEEDFNCDEYITRTLIPAIEFAAKISKRKIILAGYCMGGVLAVAAALLESKYIAALALFATPWDFSCKEFAPFVFEKKWQSFIEALVLEQKQLPADIIQSLFYLTDPWIFEQKFRRFAGMHIDSRAAKNFLALEHWVNDGVPMTSKLARDCLIGWAQQNILVRNAWKINGRSIDPAEIRVPNFIVIPKNDHVVPQDCAFALTRAIKHAHVVRPNLGHVSMMVGHSARRELWSPFLEWVKNYQ